MRLIAITEGNVQSSDTFTTRRDEISTNYNIRSKVSGKYKANNVK